MQSQPNSLPGRHQAAVAAATAAFWTSYMFSCRDIGTAELDDALNEEFKQLAGRVASKWLSPQVDMADIENDLDTQHQLRDMAMNVAINHNLPEGVHDVYCNSWQQEGLTFSQDMYVSMPGDDPESEETTALRFEVQLAPTGETLNVSVTCPETGVSIEDMVKDVSGRKRYGQVSWSVADIQSLAPGLSDEDALAWLVLNDDKIKETIVQDGWNALEVMLQCDGIDLSSSDEDDDDDATSEPSSSASTEATGDRVDAEVWHDLHVMKVAFDAVAWLRAASQAELTQLARDGWCMAESADAVALAAEGYAPAVKDFFSGLHTINDNRSPSEERVGFECRVDAEQALAWLDVNRPELAPIIRAEDEA